MENNTTTVHVGTGFCGLLTLTFIILKLTHVIAWSWLWVLSPIWIEIVFAILLGVTLGVIEALPTIRKQRERIKNSKK